MKVIVKIEANIIKINDVISKFTEAKSWISMLETLALALHSWVSDIRTTNYMKANGKAFVAT